MRRLMVGVACLAVAACSRAPDAMDAAGNTVTGAAGIAFSYGYVFRLPSARIADAQEAHARACEQLGAARCRIAGMTYRVDDAGSVSASLDLKLAAPVARGFGRAGTQAIERAGGALVGAEISGTDAEPATAAAKETGEAAAADRAQIERELARRDLSQADRATLLDHRAEIDARRRAATGALAEAQASVATTPMSFTYRAGTGVGLTARLTDAWAMLGASATATFGFVLTALAVAGPPVLVLLLLFVLWRRLGRRWWRRIADPA